MRSFRGLWFDMRKNSFTRLLRVVSVLCVLALAASCGAQEAKGDLNAEERKLRDKVSAQVEEHWEVVKDPASTAMVEMICGRLAAFTSRDLDYTARILSEESPNAFTIPGVPPKEPPPCARSKAS